MTTTAIVWYRRDLRVHDHPALRAALDGFDQVVPAFVLDDALLRGRYASGSRTGFMLGCLSTLDGELRARGGGLVVRHGPPVHEIAALAAEVAAGAVLWDERRLAVRARPRPARHRGAPVRRDRGAAVYRRLLRRRRAPAYPRRPPVPGLLAVLARVARGRAPARRPRPPRCARAAGRPAPRP